MASFLVIASLLLFCFALTCHGSGLFSSLEKTLVVKASPTQGQVLKVGEDKINVTWSLNQSFPTNIDETYSKVKVKLCYAPISQRDRAWRKTKPELSKDKTCQFTIVDDDYMGSGEQRVEWTIKRNIPTATYFVRAYVFNSKGKEVGFGQTTDRNKTTNLFDIQGISGRHASLDIAAGCFSGFSVLSLFFFFYIEKRKARNYEKR